MRVAKCGGGIKFGDVIAIGNRINGVLSRRIKAEVLGSEIAIDREIGSCKRGRAERATPCTTVKIFKTREIALKHPKESQNPMGKDNGLTCLQMGKARHDDFGSSLGLFDDFTLQFPNGFGRILAGFACPHLHCRGRLVITASCRMKATAGRSDNFRHALFDCHVDIFVNDGKDELSVANFLADLR